MKKTIDGILFGIDDIGGHMRAGYAFSASTNFISISGTSEVAMFLIKNPGGSGRDMKFHTIAFGADSNSSRGIFKFYAQPTITSNGTSLSASNNRIGDATTSIAEVYFTPTISANGTFITALILGSAQNTLIVNRPVIMTPGINILVTVQNSQNNIPVIISPLWMEIPL